MKAPQPITIDFETLGIESRPAYPPKPVGVSVHIPGEKTHYHAWGHPAKNNCSFAEAKKILQFCFSQQEFPLLFHNAKFDVDVAVAHMDCPMPAWENIHDTLYLLFLVDPYSPSFSLKPCATRWLKMPPTEQDAVHDWLIEHDIVRKNDKRWGAHIAKAPGDLVGRYAKGDVERTLKLFKLLYPQIVSRGMLDAYNRERQLMPILLENERQGIRVDTRALRRDVKIFSAAQENAEIYLRKRLGAPDLNFDASRDVAEALRRNKLVTHWEKTPTGQRSTAKKHLTRERFTDAKIWLALGYRSRLDTCLGTFMKPWLATAERSGGRIFTNWNQVRQSPGENSMTGARTGRLSTNPNFQNLPKNFYDKGDHYEHPAFPKGLPELPSCRRYILPDEDEILAHRDYNQQELRILAHYEDAELCAAYQTDPKLDVHTYVQEKIREVSGTNYERRFIKTMNFGMLYGMGIQRLADTLGVTYDEAKAMKQAQRQALSGLPDLEYELKVQAKEDEAIRTWGGREYYCEPPKEIDGETRTFEYKMLNYLIQGSAADCTKQAVINYDKLKQRGRFLVTVHDEINISAPPHALRSEMELLKEAMEAVKFDVPMVTDGKSGKNWASLKKFKEATRG